MANWFLTRAPRSLDGGGIVFSTNSAWPAEYPHAEEKSWSLTSNHVQNQLNVDQQANKRAERIKFLKKT